MRALVSFDDDQIHGGNRLAQLDRVLVFGRLPAIERRLIGGKLDYSVAAAAFTLRILETAGPNQKAGAEFPERLGIRGNIIQMIPWSVMSARTIQ
ncbi:MAG: hypothetical protein WBM09_10995 [Gallionella sp.]